MALKHNADSFIFSRHDDIGAAGAEDDSQYLSECFVDTGDVAVLLDRDNPKSIIVGRTGSGKTALLKHIQESSKNVIELSPHSLSLNYIANNNTIAFFENSGVNLSVFYGLLWKHIIVVELLRKKFNIIDETGQSNYTRHVSEIFTKKNHLKEQAIDYLSQWGSKFWLTSEERMKELTDKVDKDLSGSIKGIVPGVDISAGGALKLSNETKTQVIEHGQRAVSEVQIRELENMFIVLEEDFFVDPQQPYFVTIDMLDEEWVDNRIKLQLIKSLIDTIRRFRRLTNVKVIAGLRRDLLDEVIYSTKDAGFQEEKYKSLYLYVRWNKKQLQELIERRIKALVSRRYTKKEVGFSDIFKDRVDTQDSIKYILDRTLYRPRDAILFVNSCLAEVDEQQYISSNNIKHAEEEYSKERLKSLCTEWLASHPNLCSIACLFRTFNSSFRVSDILRPQLEERFIEIAAEITEPDNDPLSAQIDKLTDSGGNFDSVRAYLVAELHKIGIFGIKIDGSSTVNWSYQSRTSITPSELRASSLVYVHPMYHRALDIRHR